MKLPNWENAIVQQHEKVVDYLMNFSHEEGNPKAVFLCDLDFHPQNGRFWQRR